MTDMSSLTCDITLVGTLAKGAKMGASIGSGIMGASAGERQRIIT